MNTYFCEKYSVAKDLAAYLAKRHGAKPSKVSPEPGNALIGHWELPGGDAVTWLHGHMLENVDPNEYLTPGADPFDLKTLPIFPKQWKLRPKKGDVKQLDHVAGLIRKAVVVYNCGDIDREGQLVADEVLEYAGINLDAPGKPVKRVLLTALNDVSVEKALREVRDNTEFAKLRFSALARSHADWLIGMNMSRLYAGKAKTKVSVGRVQTPTLSIVVDRDREIENFKPTAFFKVNLILEDGTLMEWAGRDGEHPGIDAQGRIIDRALAEEIVAGIRGGQAGQITAADAVKKSQEPPLPFRLSDIQSLASSRLGMGLDEATQTCQKLYEKKLITYVGTDCRYLPESMHVDAAETLKGLKGAMPGIVAGANTEFQYACWNDKEVTAHHAIIPTGEAPTGLDAKEHAVFDLVAKRYIAQFYPKWEYTDYSLKAQFGADHFKASQRVTVKPGWKEVVGDQLDGERKADQAQDQAKDSDGSRQGGGRS